MYIATRPLRVPDKNGTIITLQKGDEVPNFEKWDEVPRRANLNLGWVEKVDDLSTPAPTKSKKSSKKKDAPESVK